ncbi:MAG: hypothetical protein K0S26_1588 [Bacteroidota bacterium]|jgi:hypothetical protein|nr:hypothetical protein [Bacteroidota bacterium]
MKLYVSQKIIILLFLISLCSSTRVFGQLKNFGTNATRKPEPNYLISVYGYADLVREHGIGVQYQVLAKYNVDVSVYLINPNTYFKDKIRQWDYYDLKGYGFNIKPKYQFDLLGRWYLSPNIAFEWLRHDKAWVEHMVYYHQIVNYLTETKGKAYTIGINIGRKIIINRFFLEPFLGMGVTSFKGDIITYAIDDPTVFPSQTYPIKDAYRQDYFQMNIGLKIGISFKKNKKHIAIDKKFDQVYIPKSNQLIRYFKTMDQKTIESNRNLRLSYSRTKKLNRSVLLRYKYNFRDTSAFYRKVDTLFQKIDLQLIKGNE